MPPHSAQSNKTLLRRTFLEERLNIPFHSSQKSGATISRHLLNWLIQEKKEDTWVLSFQALPGEVDLAHLHRHWPRLAFPATIGKTMFFQPWTLGTPLATGAFGVRVPISNTQLSATDLSQAVILVPCLGIDRQGYRLGYGAGFYDRFLASVPPLTKIGVTYADFVLEKFPHEDHDIPVTAIATEDGLSWLR